MVVWRIRGNEIGPDGNGAAYFPLQDKALEALAEYKAFCRENKTECHSFGPERILIRDKFDMAKALNEAMGFGCS